MQTPPYQCTVQTPLYQYYCANPHLINITLQNFTLWISLCKWLCKTPLYQYHCANPTLSMPLCKTPLYQKHCAKQYSIPLCKTPLCKPHLINTIVQNPTLSAPVQRPRLQAVEGKDRPTHHNVNNVSGKTTACDGQQRATPQRPPEGRQVRNHWQQSKPPICITRYCHQCIATVTNT